jgi:hypothetical protein
VFVGQLAADERQLRRYLPRKGGSSTERRVIGQYVYRSECQRPRHPVSGGADILMRRDRPQWSRLSVLSQTSVFGGSAGGPGDASASERRRTRAETLRARGIYFFALRIRWIINILRALLELHRGVDAAGRHRSHLGDLFNNPSVRPIAYAIFASSPSE